MARRTSPRELVAIVDRATAADPAERYPDARSMLAALDGFIVAERAAHPGESPARQLATWLAAAWAGARDDDAGASGERERPDLVSLFDDDAAAVGTGTERSLAETADAPAPELAPAAPAASAGSAAPAEARPIVRRLAWLAPLAVAAVLGAVLASRRCGTAGDRDPDRAADAALAPLLADAAPVSADAAPVSADAAPLLADAAPLLADAAPDRPRPVPDAPAQPHAVPPLPLDAGPAAADASAPRAARKVRVNARPWATFTVDGGATSYETISTIELAPGPHRLHFSNPQLGVERDVTIQVPADRDLDHVEDLRR